MKIRRILTSVFIFLVFFCANEVFAQTECVFGFVNDPAPGNCSSYVDQNGNDLCDLSEVPLSQSNSGEAVATLTEEEMKAKTVKEVAESYGIETSLLREELTKYLGFEVKGNDSMLDLHDNNGLCTGVAGSIALKIKEGGGVDDVQDHDLISGEEVKVMKVYEVAEVYGIKAEELANAIADSLDVPVKQTETIEFYHDNYGLEAHFVKELANEIKEQYVTEEVSEPVVATSTTAPRYRFLPITVTMVIFYLLTYILVKEKKMTLLTHKRIWNVVLLLSFLASAILGILLIVRINWGWYIDLPFNILYWHVETGTVMAVASIFHMFYVWRFYACMLKRKKKDDCR